MRTTLTLDDDVAAKLKSLTRRSGASFKDVVNDTLRRGLARASRAPAPPPILWNTRPMGLRPGLSLDCIGALLEEIEGPEHR